MPISFPPYIFGLHDPGDWMNAVEAARKQGWVLVTEEVRNAVTGRDYSNHARRGFGVIVRLNWGYGDAGTIPTPPHYDDFANRCGDWVARSQGCNIWIIGNEMNLAAERPGGPAEQNKITPAQYAQAFQKCRTRIRAAAGHAEDLVVVGAIGPWNNETKYPGNDSGDWVRYLADILNLVKPNCDGVAVHAYTHGTDPNLIFSNEPQGAFPQYNNQFRTYRDFVRAIPPELRGVPVFITEAQPTPDSGGWQPVSRGWVTIAYKEINDWNSDPANQPVQCLMLFRWDQGDPRWSISDKDWVQEDFQAALRNEYRVRLPSAPPPAKVYRATFISTTAPAAMPADGDGRVTVTVQNDGTFTWSPQASSPVRFGYRWFDANGNIIPARESVRTPLPRDVPPGDRITVSNARVVAPPNPARYQLRLDLVEEGVTWFSDAGSPPNNTPIDVVRGGGVELPDYAATFQNAIIPETFARDAATNATLTVRNDGQKTWPATGERFVRLGYHWFAPNSTQETWTRQLVRASLPRDIRSGESVTLTIPVLAPLDPGPYTLLFDMVVEGFSEFRALGGTALTRSVKVVGPEYFVTWLSAPVPGTLSVVQKTPVRVSVRNDGTKTWAAGGANPVRLLYFWFDRFGRRVLAREDIRASLPRDIAPGQMADLSIDVLAPEQPGAMTLRFDLVEEGITFFTNKASPPLDRAVQVQGTQDYQVSFGDSLLLAPVRTQVTQYLKLRNDGRLTWLAGGANPVTLGYHWFDLANRPVAVMTDIRTPLPRDIAPGEELLVAATTVTPDLPGHYRLQWSLVLEGVAWFYDLGARALNVSAEVALGNVPPGAPSPIPAPLPIYRAAFTPLTFLTTMDADATRTFEVKVRNDGTKTWAQKGDHPVHAGYRWYRGNQPVPVRLDLRTELPSDIASGQETSFGAQIVSPPDPDVYTLRFDLVEEGVTWFSDSGTSQPLDLTVQVRRAGS